MISSDMELLARTFMHLEKDVSTIDELVMVMSLDLKLARPIEAKSIVKQAISLGYLEQRGDFVRTTEKLARLSPRYNARATGIVPMAKQRESFYRTSGWVKDATRNTLPPTQDEIGDEIDLQEDYERWFYSQLPDGILRPATSEERMRFYDSYDFRDDDPQEFIYSDEFDEPIQEPPVYRRRKTNIGKRFMMLPDDGNGFVPISHIQRIQEKRSWKSKLMDGRKRSAIVFPNPPKREDAAKWINRPNKYDIEGIDAPSAQKSKSVESRIVHRLDFRRQ